MHQKRTEEIRRQERDQQTVPAIRAPIGEASEMIKQAKIKAVACIAVVLALAGLSSALAPGAALASGPEFVLYSTATDYALAGEEVPMEFAIENVGDVRSKGPITFSDTVTPGLTVPSLISEVSTSIRHPEVAKKRKMLRRACKTSGLTLTCTIEGALPPGAKMIGELIIYTEAGASGTLTRTLNVSGGEAPSVSTTHEINIGPPGPFEFGAFGIGLRTSKDCSPHRQQAGSTPTDMTVSLRFKTFQGNGAQLEPYPIEHFKNVTTHLPAGFVGNPTATAALCTAAQWLKNRRSDRRKNFPSARRTARWGWSTSTSARPRSRSTTWCRHRDSPRSSASRSRTRSTRWMPICVRATRASTSSAATRRRRCRSRTDQRDRVGRPGGQKP